MIKQTISNCLQIIVKDIAVNWTRFLLLLFLMLFPHFVYRLYENKIVEVFIVNLINGFFELFLLWGISSMLWKWLRLLFRILLFLLISIDFCLNLGSYISIRKIFGLEEMYLVLGTNFNESIEFFSAYFSWGHFIICALLFIIILTISFKDNKLIKPTKSFSLVVWMLFFGSLCISIINPHFIQIFPIKYYGLAKLYVPTPDLSLYKHDITINSNPYYPNKIIIIIGESFSKDHSSLYHYDKVTNPHISELVNSEKITLYKNVTSPWVNTTPVFKELLTANRDTNTGPWYERITIFDIFRNNYQIYWISNQCRTGIYDNVQVAFAELSDRTWFSEGKTDKDKGYDEVVIAPLKKLLEESNEKSLIFINLMGQHVEFQMRYPKEFDRFKEIDYPDLLPYQKQTIASYDNATLYNDSIVSELFKSLDAFEALAFYFSDHGLDLYVTDPNHCAHARSQDPMSFNIGTQIPFMVYTNDKLNNNYPELVAKVKNYRNKCFCTNSFIDYLCEILDLDYVVEN